jgi:hypothetical protein
MGTITPPPPLPPELRPRAAAPAAAPPVSSGRGRPGRRILLLLAAVGVAAALYAVRSKPRLAAGTLPLVGPDGQAAAATRSVDGCAGEKGCLVVYVAPWCGPCRRSLPGDVALADYLKGRGYETTFVVGMDKYPSCVEMVRSLGREAFVDESGAWAKKMGVSGVPHFLVTDREGRVRKRQAGALLASPEVVAQHLGM